MGCHSHGSKESTVKATYQNCKERDASAAGSLVCQATFYSFLRALPLKRNVERFRQYRGASADRYGKISDTANLAEVDLGKRREPSRFRQQARVAHRGKSRPGPDRRGSRRGEASADEARTAGRVSR